jgi:hypothetical protein
MSFNTLYRAYEQKYNPESEILRKYLNEDDRLEEITGIVSEYLDQYTVICLQECSLELIELLRPRIQTHTLFTHNIRDEEYLVTMTPTTAGFSQETCEVQPGANGCLIVSNHKYRVVNYHLIPQKYAQKGVKVLDYVRNLPQDKICIVAGDFNEKHKKVKNTLRDRYIVPFFGRTYRQRSIDHIIVDKSIKLITTVNYTTRVIETDNVSDHKGILLTMDLS